MVFLSGLPCKFDQLRVAAIFLLSISYFRGYGQADSTRTIDSHPFRVVWKVNMIPLPLGSINTFVELGFGQQRSFSLGFNFWQSKKGSLIYNDFDQRQLGVIGEFRKYLFQANVSEASGFFMAPYVRFRITDQQNVINYHTDSLGLASIAKPAQNQTWAQFGIGFSGGYSVCLHKRIQMEVLAGLGTYLFTSLKTQHPEWVVDKSRVSRIDLRVGLMAGYVF